MVPTKKTGAKKRRRTITWNDPVEDARIWSGMTGLDYLRGVRDGRIAVPPVAALIGFRLVEVEPGRAVVAIEPAEYHYNRFSRVQGGIVSVVLDAAIASALHSTLPASAGFTSLEIKVTYHRPVSIARKPLRCLGSVIHKGTTTAVVEARMLDSDDTLYAHAISTCLIFHETKDTIAAGP